MRFRNAFHITIDNFSSAFKLLVYRLIVSVLTLSLVYVILELALSVIVTSTEVDMLVGLVGEFFRALVSGDSARLSTFQSDFTSAIADVLVLIAENGGAIAGAVVGVCLIYLLSRFLNGLSHFAAASIMNDRMSAFSRTTFSEAFFRNIGSAALYEVIYVPITFVYDAITLLACWFLFFYLPSLFPSWGFLSVLIALSLTVAVYLCMQSLKLTFVSAWIPSVLSGKTSVAKGMSVSFRSRKNLLHRFASFLVANYIIVVVNLVFMLFTLGSAGLITVPLSYLFLLSIQFVHYYEDGGRKYFVSVNNIAGNTQSEYPTGDSLEEINKKINASSEERTEASEKEDAAEEN